LSRVELLRKDLDDVRFEMGRPKNLHIEMAVLNAAPHEVLFQARSLYRKVDRLVVEADASPLDVDVIQVGGAAKIRFASLSAKLTPLLDGKVIHLAADSSTSDDGERVYLMRLTIPLAELEKLGDIAIIPGMPVEVLIDKGEQTLVAYLAEPLTSVMFRSLVEE